jgi:WD40 repeat protein
VHALGVIWYQALTGDLSGGAPSGLHWLRELKQRGMSEPLLGLLASCLEGRPEDRPADAALLAQRLAPLCQPAAPAAPPPPPREVAPPPDRPRSGPPPPGQQASSTRKGRRWLVPAGAAGLVLLVLLVWLLAVRKHPLKFDPDEVETWRASHEAVVYSVALSANGKLALSGGADGRVRLWDATTGDPLHTFKLDKGCTAVALSADGKYALAGEGHQVPSVRVPPFDVHLWDLQTWQEVRSFKGHNDWIEGVAFLDDGRRFLSSTWTEGLWLWERDGDGQPRRRTPAGGPAGDAGFGGVLALSADGRSALLREAPDPPNDLLLWDVQGWTGVRTLKGHTKRISHVALSADGQRALSSDFGKSVLVWDVTKREPIRELSDHHPTVAQGLAVSPDGRWGATGSGYLARPDGLVDFAESDCVIRLFDLDTGKELRRFERHTAPITSLVFSADGRYLLSGSHDGTLRLWRLAK